MRRPPCKREAAGSIPAWSTRGPMGEGRSHHPLTVRIRVRIPVGLPERRSVGQRRATCFGSRVTQVRILPLRPTRGRRPIGRTGRRQRPDAGSSPVGLSIHRKHPLPVMPKGRGAGPISPPNRFQAPGLAPPRQRSPTAAEARASEARQCRFESDRWHQALREAHGSEAQRMGAGLQNRNRAGSTPAVPATSAH